MDIRTSGNQDAGYQETRASGSHEFANLITWCPDNHYLITWCPDNHYLIT